MKRKREQTWWTVMDINGKVWSANYDGTPILWKKKPHYRLYHGDRLVRVKLVEVK